MSQAIAQPVSNAGNNTDGDTGKTIIVLAVVVGVVLLAGVVLYFFKKEK